MAHYRGSAIRLIFGLRVVLIGSFLVVATVAFGQEQSGVFVIADMQPGPRYRWLAVDSTSGAGRWVVRDGVFSTDGAAYYDADTKPYAVMGDYPGKDEILQWSPDTTHVLIGSNKLKGVAFKSDPKYPLTFRLIKGKGYVYLCGRGTVTTKDGKQTRLGYSDTVDAWLLFIHSDDAMRAQAAAQALGYLAKTPELKDKALPALIAATQRDKGVSWYACEALGRIGDKRALISLGELKEKGGAIGRLAEESMIYVAPPDMPEKGKLSYAIGVLFGSSLSDATKDMGLTLDIDTVFSTVRDLVNGKNIPLAEKDARIVVNQALAAMESKVIKDNKSAPEMPKKQKLSQAVGVLFGLSILDDIKNGSLSVDTDKMLGAARDVVEGKPCQMDKSGATDVMRQCQGAVFVKKRME